MSNAHYYFDVYMAEIGKTNVIDACDVTVTSYNGSMWLYCTFLDSIYPIATKNYKRPHRPVGICLICTTILMSKWLKEVKSM